MGFSDTWLKANSGKARPALEERSDRDAPALQAPRSEPVRVVLPHESLQHPLGVYDALLDEGALDELLEVQP
jgi:hypothetical protein